MSGVTHSLVGYDRRTERVADEIDVPDAVLPNAKELANVPADDPDAVMCYRLQPSVARDLASILRAKIDTAQHDYFLEGFAAAGFAGDRLPALNYEFADDECFRRDGASYSVHIHNDALGQHVKVIVQQQVLDDYARLKGARRVAEALNERLRPAVQTVVNRAIADGRTTAGAQKQYRCLELDRDDLVGILGPQG